MESIIVGVKEIATMPTAAKADFPKALHLLRKGPFDEQRAVALQALVFHLAL